ncbi:TPA: glycosyltransferase family 4 protein [Candidatus Woesearchaeota archaeon]|nr:Glycosyltransferase [archaeon GW2011_AR15]MBS3104509.1 glycosyltransferase family 4 protein [Candidatus Woesearchaeota archaeon]HIH41177.1 glycosyltransferase family 4 protein [Candidatus Woesearchaeota archaeon]
MNILIIHPHDIYSASEPWTIRITSIAHEFVKKGHRVKLVYFPLSGKERGKLKEKITEYETIPFNRSKWYLFSNMKKMAEFGKWADVIHFQKCFSIASIPAIFSAYVNNKPVHYDWDDWEYGIYMFSPPSRIYGWYLNVMEKLLPKLVDSVSVASEELRSMVLEMGFPESRIVKANVCADLDRFSPKYPGAYVRKKYKIEKNPVVLYLGQLHGAQYAQQFIRSARLILKKMPKAKFMIVGGGQDLPRLNMIVMKMGLQKEIIFTGFAVGKEVNEYLAAADVVVGSFADTKQQRCKSPLKIAEYMASGKAIVASNVGEIPWMLGDAGLLYEPGNYQEMADKVMKLLKNKALRKKLEKKARERAERMFRWEIVADRLLKLYKRDLSQKHI